MRKYAILNNIVNNVKKVMIYIEEGVYIFLYDRIEDVPSFSDEYVDTLEEAEKICFYEYNIKDSDWMNINDPIEECQEDIISPVRTKGVNLGKPEWGKFEKLVDDKWIEFKF